MNCRISMALMGLGILLLTGNPLEAAPEPKVSAAGRAFFENRIRPVLVAQCYECHSTEAEEIGGRLILDSREALLRGGESGPALVPGSSEQSLLLQALRWEHGLEMPPEEPLSEAVVRDFARWIEMGAPDPRSGGRRQVAGKTYGEGDLWAFEPVIDPIVPEVRNRSWPRDDVDRFVLAQIEALELEPGRDAGAATLLRRLHFDLTGLPPSLEAQQAFERDRSRRGHQAAVEKVVDDLLASPQFGERWGRHWLDVARFAESNGNDGLSRNPTFPHAWRYRDYVIEAFNEDTPFDRFITEQLAGDLLVAASAEERDRLLVATGFLALGAKPAKAMNNNFDMDVVADQIDVVGRGIMGLSVACARCHDHKFDPIPARDYYAMAGLFTSSETLWGLAGNEKLTAPATDLHVLKTAVTLTPPEGFVETVILRESATGKPKAIPKPKWEAGTPLAMGIRDKAKPADCRVNLKGDAKKLGERVSRGFLSASDFGDRCGTSPSVDPRQSGRLQLAQWLIDPRHPQTARVFANRVWQHLFGRGIVATPDDFGVYGERPTHPELLDHLASRFVAGGWSTKTLIRELVLSRTYQLDSHADPASLEADPDNLWLTRHTRRRLDAESLRDSLLFVSGRLELAPGEGSIIEHRDILVNLAGNLHQPSRHRSVYLCYLRNSPPPELAAFDLPSFTEVTGKRHVSTLPGHALFLYNSPMVIEQAMHLAEQIRGAEGVTPGSGDAEGAEAAFLRVLNRMPNPEERYRALALVAEARTETGSDLEAWACLCQALMSSNEFRYVD